MAFQKSIVSSTAGSCSQGSMILLGLLAPEDEGTMPLKNTGNYTQNDTTAHPEYINMATTRLSGTRAHLHGTTWHHL
jgi:hypothetical protein